MFLKDFNNFYHPMAVRAFYDKDYEFEIALQIGGKKFPEYPLTSQAETFAALKKCMGIHNSAFHSLDISPEEYRRHKYIVGIDTEKVLGASFSGENIKNGSLLTLMMKNIGNNSDNYPTTITVVMHAD
jgi:DNA mismatch repair protein MutH